MTFSCGSSGTAPAYRAGFFPTLRKWTRELGRIGWNAKADDLPNGVKLTVTSTDPKQVTKLKALGFMGIMVQGAHHRLHHLAMARGEFDMH